MEAAVLHYMETSWRLAGVLLHAQKGELEALDEQLRELDSSAYCNIDAASLGAEETCRLRDAVFLNRGLFATLASWATQGALHALSMTSRLWLSEAYEGATAEWASIDVADWPFAAKELRANSIDAAAGTSAPEQATDEDLDTALARVPPGALRRLVARSSHLTDEGVQRALRKHGAELSELKLSSRGSDLLSGASLTPLRRRGAAQSLRSLELDEIKWPGLRGLARCCQLERLSLSGHLCARSVHAVGAFTNLRVLKVAHSDRTKLPQAPFLYIFHKCTQLHTVDIRGATQVTDTLLHCLMSRNQSLKDFRGSCGRLPALLPKFVAHYPHAERMEIDEVDAVRGAVAQFMEGAMIQLIDTMLARLHHRLQRDDRNPSALQATRPTLGDIWYP
mmetsp:Transcript_56322/g.132003  ORF Transcript_56322/g.132003 Transcript_56322/m.132003 type:complete len:393 (+) Transcript_56322:76-1254(+)